MGYALDLLSLSGSALVNENSVTFITILSLFPSLMGEELIKFIPLMFFLRIIYKYTENRKLSIILSMFIVMMFFALLHLSDLHSIVSVIVLQGFGTIFEFYGYLKTKNIFISYLTHLLTDLSLFIIMLIGL
jgi:membrane protease YdiL (CAAX protease family)